MTTEATLTPPPHDHDYGSQIEVIRSDLERLRGDFTKLSQEVAEDAGERMKHYTDLAADKIKERGEAIHEAGERGKRIAAVEVNRHPFASVLGAAGAGLALGALALWAQNGDKH